MTSPYMSINSTHQNFILSIIDASNASVQSTVLVSHDASAADDVVEDDSAVDNDDDDALTGVHTTLWIPISLFWLSLRFSL